MSIYSLLDFFFFWSIAFPCIAQVSDYLMYISNDDLSMAMGYV